MITKSDPVSLALVVLVVVFCALRASDARQRPTSDPNPTGARVGSREVNAVVSGRVFRADSGEPLQGAVITLSPCHVAGVMWTAKAVSGADGRYVVSTSPFCYFAGASAIGFVPQGYGRDTAIWPKPLSLHSGESIQDVDFRLPVAASIPGVVYDQNAQPVVNIRVSALQRQFSSGGVSRLRAIETVMTDREGKFLLGKVGPGDYFICADAAHATAGATGPAPGLTYRKTCYPSSLPSDQAKEVHAIAGTETPPIRLQVTADKTFTVFADIDDPDVGTNRRSYIPDLSRIGFFSSSRGKTLTIPQVFPGTYTLSIEALDGDNFVGEGSRTVRIVDADVHVVVPISPLSRVGGRITVQPPSRASGVQLILLGLDGESSRSSVDDDGNFEFKARTGQHVFAVVTDSTAGQTNWYVKQARCSGKDHTVEPLSIAPGQVVSGCDVILSNSTGTIRGSVSEVNANKPGGHMVVVLIPHSIAARKIRHRTLTTISHAVGRFAMAGVAPGEYFILAVPLDENRQYYSLDFPERHRNVARSVTINPGDSQYLTVEPLKMQ